MECAAAHREVAIYSALGATGASVASSVTAYSAADPGRDLGSALILALSSLTFGCAGCGLGLYGLYENYQAVQVDRKVASIVAAETLEGCTMGDEPRERTPTAPPALPLPPAPRPAPPQVNPEPTSL